jgi:hypothetical protein
MSDSFLVNLINAETAEVDFGAGNFTGFPTNRELTANIGQDYLKPRSK